MEPWARDAPVDLQPTHLPSLLFNNLASSRGLIAYAHDSQVSILEARGTNNKRTLQLRTKVLSSIFVDHETFVVGAAGYVEIWQVPSPAKARLVKRHALGDYADDDATVPFCRGAVGRWRDLRRVFFRRNSEVRGGSNAIVRGHRAPLVSRLLQVVSGRDRGEHAVGRRRACGRGRHARGRHRRQPPRTARRFTRI